MTSLQAETLLASLFKWIPNHSTVAAIVCDTGSAWLQDIAIPGADTVALHAAYAVVKAQQNNPFRLPDDDAPESELGEY